MGVQWAVGFEETNSPFPPFKLGASHTTLVKRKASIKVTRRYRKSSSHMYYEVLLFSFPFWGFSSEINKRFPTAADHVFSHVCLIIESSRTHPIRKIPFDVSFGSRTNLLTLLRGLVAHRYTRPTTA
jgi:hypothetical protein